MSTLTNKDNIEPVVSIKLACLVLLNSRVIDIAWGRIRDFVAGVADTCKSIWLQRNSQKTVNFEGTHREMGPAIVDFISAVVRVFCVDTVEYAFQTSTGVVSLYELHVNSLPDEIRDSLIDIPVDNAAEKEVVWRAESNEYPSLLNDPNFSACVLFVLQKPVCKQRSGSLSSDGPGVEAGATTLMSSRSRCMSESSLPVLASMSPSSAAKLISAGMYSPGGNDSIKAAGPVLNRHRSISQEHYLELKEGREDEQRHDTSLYISGKLAVDCASAASLKASGVVSPEASPRKQSEDSPLKRTPSIVRFGSASEADGAAAPVVIAIGGGGGIGSPTRAAAGLPPVARSVSGENADSPCTPRRSEAQSAQTPLAGSAVSAIEPVVLTPSRVPSSSSIATMPYQPPPTSWGLGSSGLPDSALIGVKESPNRSASGITTTSSMSSHNSGAPVVVTIGNEDEWQRLATPWLYLPSAASSFSAPLSSGGSEYAARSGLYSPMNTNDDRVDKGKLSNLKRPGRNFRSSGASRKGDASAVSSARAFSAEYDYTDGSGSLADETFTPKTWDSSGQDLSEGVAAPPITSRSFSGRIGVVGEALGNKSHLPGIVSSSTPHEKGSYSGDGSVRQGQLIRKGRLGSSRSLDVNDGDDDLSAASVRLTGGGSSRKLFDKDDGTRDAMGQTLLSVAQLREAAPSVGSIKAEHNETDLLEDSGGSGARRNHAPPLSSTRKPSRALALSIESPSHAQEDSAHLLDNLFDSPAKQLHSRGDFGAFAESPMAAKSRKRNDSSPSPAVMRSSRRSVLGRGGFKGGASRDEEADEGAAGAGDSQTTQADESSAHLPKIGAGLEDEEGLPLHKTTDAYDYIPSSEIKALDHPSRELNAVVRGLEKDDWPEIFHTLNKLRSLSLHHQTVIVNSGVLHGIVVGLLKQVRYFKVSLLCSHGLA